MKRPRPLTLEIAPLASPRSSASKLNLQVHARQTLKPEMPGSSTSGCRP